MDKFTINIDGKEIKAKAGQTIMEAAIDAGIYIPHLCYSQELIPGGHCRVCTVMVNGRPQSACTHPVGDGMVVENDTPELLEERASSASPPIVKNNTHRVDYAHKYDAQSDAKRDISSRSLQSDGCS